MAGAAAEGGGKLGGRTATGLAGDILTTPYLEVRHVLAGSGPMTGREPQSGGSGYAHPSFPCPLHPGLTYPCRLRPKHERWPAIRHGAASGLWVGGPPRAVGAFGHRAHRGGLRLQDAGFADSGRRAGHQLAFRPKRLPERYRSQRRRLHAVTSWGHPQAAAYQALRRRLSGSMISGRV